MTNQAPLGLMCTGYPSFCIFDTVSSATCRDLKECTWIEYVPGARAPGSGAVSGGGVTRDEPGRSAGRTAVVVAVSGRGEAGVPETATGGAEAVLEAEGADAGASVRASG